MIFKTLLTLAPFLASLAQPCLAVAMPSKRATTYPEPISITGNTSSVRDPTLCKDPATSTYYLFTTGPGIEIRTSKDLKSWDYLGEVWQSGESTWADAYNGASNVFWAPDCTIQDGKWILYYSASTISSQNSAIFVSTSTTGQPGSFSKGELVVSTTSSDDYNAIDPNLIISGSEYYLSLGSYWTGIKGAQVDSSSFLFSSSPSAPTYDKLAQRYVPGPTNEEGSVIFKNGNYFYLFTSWGVDKTYEERVARSQTFNSGYVAQNGTSAPSGGGTLILASHDDVTGPGGADLFQDDDGTVYIVYHYIASNNEDTLGINKVDFSSGWPVLK